MKRISTLLRECFYPRSEDFEQNEEALITLSKIGTHIAEALNSEEPVMIRYEGKSAFLRQEGGKISMQVVRMSKPNHLL